MRILQPIPGWLSNTGLAPTWALFNMNNLLSPFSQTLAAATLALGVASSAWAGNAAPGTSTPVNIEAKVAMCIGCHGIHGYQSSFPEVHKVPKISGQSAKYIANALVAYQKDERKHPTMKSIAASLTEQDITEIAAYYEQHGLAQTPAVPETPAEAPAKVKALLEKGACISCHGANFNKPIDGSYPKIAGQYADYLYVALKSYQTEGNSKVGRSNAIMAGQVKNYTHAELRLIANYISSLPGDLKTIPQARLR